MRSMNGLQTNKWRPVTDIEDMIRWGDEQGSDKEGKKLLEDCV